MWSHEIDDGSNGSGDGDSLVAQNVSCMARERASGAFDARHVFNFNAIYELPFGSGKPYLSSPGALRTIFGSWEVSSLVTARTGFPVNVTLERDSSDTPDGNTNNQRPDLVPGVSLAPPGRQLIGAWINPAAFATPAPGTWGDAPRNLLRAPGAWQFDAGISKRLLLTERVQLQFRADVFNIFNHPQYGLPNSDVSAEGFGQIASTINSGPVGTGTPRELQFALRVGVLDDRAEREDLGVGGWDVFARLRSGSRIRTRSAPPPDTRSPLERPKRRFSSSKFQMVIDFIVLRNSSKFVKRFPADLHYLYVAYIAGSR